MPGPVNDGYAVTTFLVKDLRIAVDNVIFLCNETAMHDRIVQTLTSLKDNQRIKRGDSILLYFAGFSPQNISLDNDTPIFFPYDAHSKRVISYKCLTDIIEELYVAYGDNIVGHNLIYQQYKWRLLARMIFYRQ